MKAPRIKSTKVHVVNYVRTVGSRCALDCPERTFADWFDSEPQWCRLFDDQIGFKGSEPNRCRMCLAAEKRAKRKVSP